MGDIAGVKSRVQDILTANFSGVTLERDGFSVRSGSARGFILVTSNGEQSPTIVHLEFPVLFRVPESPELYQHIAEHANDYTFGHFSVARNSEGSLTVMLTHRLLGDYLDADEILYALTWLGHTADQVDDELKAQFGGERFHES